MQAVRREESAGVRLRLLEPLRQWDGVRAGGKTSRVRLAYSLPNLGNGRRRKNVTTSKSSTLRYTLISLTFA